MSRKFFKVTCILSVILFFLLILFTLFSWFLANVGGVLFLMLTLGALNFVGISLPEFLENFVGSPLFYVFLVDILAFLGSVTGLILVKKPPKQPVS